MLLKSYTHPHTHTYADKLSLPDTRVVTHTHKRTRMKRNVTEEEQVGHVGESVFVL